jgi:hypothetical protein
VQSHAFITATGWWPLHQGPKKQIKPGFWMFRFMSFAGQKWRPNVELDYDFRNSSGVSTWTVRAGVAPLLPSS